jgi:phenylacetate-CoA ligase
MPDNVYNGVTQPAALISLQLRPDIRGLIDFARKYSPYYGSLYSNVPRNVSSLQDYPVVDLDSFWKANAYKETKVITMPHSGGIVWKTGGTVGNPKITFISQDELRSTSSQLGRAIIEAGLLSTDRIANLFYAGDLYGSFLLHVLSIQDLSVPSVHIPIGGSCDLPTTIQYMKELDATVIFGTVTKVVQLAQYLLARKETMDQIRVFMFAGEAFFHDQKSTVHAAFPLARIRSLVYGSMDAGVMGYSASDTDWRLHQVNRPFVELEICPDSAGTVPTTKPMVPGRLLVTNLSRRLQPVIRYPCGDRAEWVDQAEGLFRVLGRHNESARVGPVSLDVSHVREIIDQAFPGAPISGIQLVINRVHSLDSLTIRIGYHPPDIVEATKAVVAKLKEQRPMFQQHVDLKLICPLQVAFVDAKDLTVNVRTGKLAGLVDQRPTEDS